MSMKSRILHQSCWARTSSDRCIELHSSLSHGSAPILFVGGVHGDEPEGVELATQLLGWLQKNNKICVHDWLLIPCLNVDGYKKNERTNARGIDLNRNFPSKDWSPDSKSPRYNPGTHASSESETKALVALIKRHKPKLIVHFHSWQPCVVYTGSKAKSWAEKMADGTGYEVREDIGYPTPGSLGQYGWIDCHTPVVCLEAQEKADLATIWPQFQKGLQRLLTEA